MLLYNRSVYPLNAQPTYHYTTPLFETWAGVPSSELGDWDIRPGKHLNISRTLQVMKKLV